MEGRCVEVEWKVCGGRVEGVWGFRGRRTQGEETAVQRRDHGVTHGSTPLCLPRVVRVVVTHRAWLGSGLRSGLGLGPGSVAVSGSQGQGQG